MSRIRLREIRRVAEYAAVQRIVREVWKFDDRHLPSTVDLQAAGYVGGMTAGAFDGSEMVGFVHGFPRANLGEPCQHSHMLAVRAPWRGRGLSARLKLFQRAWCLRHGIRLVTWTYDPFRITNARLNLNRLRARARRYLPNLYGPLGGLYEGLPSDRFEVHWRLDAPEVERAARGLAPEPPEAADLPLAAAGRIPRAARLAVAARDPEGRPGTRRGGCGAAVPPAAATAGDEALRSGVRGRLRVHSGGPRLLRLRAVPMSGPRPPAPSLELPAITGAMPENTVQLAAISTRDRRSGGDRLTGGNE